MIDYTQLLGFAAGILTTFSVVPQVLKTYRTRSAKDLSEHWLEMLLVGVVMWTIYGVEIASLPLILANAVSVVLVSLLLLLKLERG